MGEKKKKWWKMESAYLKQMKYPSAVSPLKMKIDSVFWSLVESKIESQLLHEEEG